MIARYITHTHKHTYLQHTYKHTYIAYIHTKVNSLACIHTHIYCTNRRGKIQFLNQFEYSGERCINAAKLKQRHLNLFESELLFRGLFPAEPNFFLNNAAESFALIYFEQFFFITQRRHENFGRKQSRYKEKLIEAYLRSQQSNRTPIF